MERYRGGRFLGIFLVALGLAAPARAQDPAPPEKKKPPRRLKLEAERTDVRETKGESRVILRGGAHIRFVGAKDLADRPQDRQLLDVRADDAVAFVPAEPDLRRAAPPLRALYAEGHVRLERREGLGEPLLVEAEALYVDLVAERGYAVNAVIRVPGKPVQRTLPSPTIQKGNLSSSPFALRAERLRIVGTGLMEAEGASFSICDFGLPHEAVEATLITISETSSGRDLPTALTASAALGGPGATWIARRAERDLPFRAYRDLIRGKAQGNEGSDAVFHALRDPRFVRVDGARARIRPPYLGEEGIGVPFPLPLAWGTDWPFPDVRFGRSSKFGVFATGEVRVPILRPEIVHDAKDKHVHRGLSFDAIGGGGFFERRGPTGTGGGVYEYLDAEGRRLARGDFRGTYIQDRADEDRNGSLVPNEDRYFVRGLHQQELPLGVHVDAEASKQSDRNYLLEYQRNVARTQKEQETYVYARGTRDEFGARLIGRWRMNDFQSQVEELPRARLDLIASPLFTSKAGGLYFTSVIEGAHLRRRFDDATGIPDERLVRTDLEARADYKLSMLDVAYFRAFGSGRFTAWSERATSEEAIERIVGATGARLGTQLDGRFTLSESLALRHVLIPEVGYDHRPLVTRDPASIIQIDEVDSLRAGSYAFARVRNRFLIAKDTSGREAREALDLTVEGRYFPTDERQALGVRRFGTIYADGRIYLGTFGTLRVVSETDPTRRRLLRLDETFTFLATRAFRAWFTDAKDDRIVYPDLAVEVSYRDIVDQARALGYAVDIRLTPSWGVRFEQQYDFRSKDFLRHRAIARRYFHAFAVEVTASYDPILNDTQFSFAIVPTFGGDAGDSFRDSSYSSLAY